MEDMEYFKNRKEKAREIYDSQGNIYCPYFQIPIFLTSDGFHHLQFSARRERDKREQLLKFSLYWGLIAIVGEKKIKIRVVLRQVGDGNIIFWSVMPYSKLKRNQSQKLYTEYIEDE